MVSAAYNSTSAPSSRQREAARIAIFPFPPVTVLTSIQVENFPTSQTHFIARIADHIS